MAKKEILSNDGDMTIAVKKEEKKYSGPYVQVFLPELDNLGEEGMQVDQYEHVTIANEDGEKVVRIHRGEHVMVPVAAFIALYERYGKRL